MSRADFNAEFPKAILHVDGDSFFVSCELTRRPWLKGKPAVTGEERGIATAVNPAAKALGVVRGMRTRDIRRNYPSVIILRSDYVMYSLYARRMYAIVRRYAGEDRVEEYSIDECFADISGAPDPAAVAAAIQADLYASLGITFSVGLSVNKVMAKAASKWRKPFGLTVIPRGAIRDLLKDIPVGKVWGIGSATTVYLNKLGVTTALQLAEQSRAWVAEHCDRPLAEIYEEFQGNYVKALQTGGGGSVGFYGNSSRTPGSLQHTRTFYPPVGADSAGRAFLWSQLSYHLEEACARLRARGLAAGRASFFLKTQSFEYIRAEMRLSDPSAAPQEILRAIGPEFEKLWRSVGGGSKLYEDAGARRRALMFRAAGIGLSGLQAEAGGAATQSLFAALPGAMQMGSVRARSGAVHAAVDRLARRFGRHAVFLGSSFKALQADGELAARSGARPAERKKPRPFDVIYLGEVR